MSNIQIHKKGGPYTKQEQEKRRKQVYKLYFEEAKSVIKIAEILDVNRNTINEDVKYWYSQLALEINSETVVSSALKQIHNMELQKTRLREQLDCTAEFSQRLAIEKLLFEIDSKLAGHITKVMSSGKEFFGPSEIEVSEEEIKKLVREMVLENESPNEDADVYSENEIEFEMIRKTSCDVKYAQAVLKKMARLGLGLCRQDKTSESFNDEIDFSQTYDLGRFANLRSYISIDEFAKINKKRIKIREEIKKLEEEKRLASLQPKDCQGSTSNY